MLENGQIFASGQSLHGQCGVGPNLVTAPTVVASLGGIYIACVAVGMSHTLACSDAGEPGAALPHSKPCIGVLLRACMLCAQGAVYSWGCGRDGQLGLGDDTGRDKPNLVEDESLAAAHIVKVRVSGSALASPP